MAAIRGRWHRDKRRAEAKESKAGRPLWREVIVGGGLPAYLSAIFAAMALLIAWNVYESWSNQELKKRRADIALGVLRSVLDVNECFAANLDTYLLPNLPSKQIYEAIVDQIKAFEKCDGALTEMRLQGDLANVTLDPKIFFAISGYAMDIEPLRGQLRLAKFGYDGYKETDWNSPPDEPAKQTYALFKRFNSISMDLPKETPAISTIVEQRTEEVRDAVRRFLVLQGDE